MPLKGKLPKIQMEPTQKKKPKPEPINLQDIKRPVKVKESSEHRLNIIFETVEYILETRVKRAREKQEQLVKSSEAGVKELEDYIRTHGDKIRPGQYRKPSEMIASGKGARELITRKSATRKRIADRLRTLRSTGHKGRAQGELDAIAGEHHVRDEKTGLRIKK